MSKIDPIAEQQLEEDIADFVGDPLGYVLYVYPWMDMRDIQIVRMPKYYQDLFQCEFGPDEWAIDTLEDWGERIRENAFDGRSPVPPVRYSIASGHGIGKTAFSGWAANYILDTRPRSRGTVTANTSLQLQSKTWSAIGFWRKIGLTAHWFRYTTGKGSMALRSTKKDPIDGRLLAEEWKCEGQTCRAENAESFQGQHAPTASSFFLFDEASGIDRQIFEAREGGLATGEPFTFDFGNPTQNTGMFFENTVGKFKDQFITRQIDSRTVQISNKPLFSRWQKAWGEDSDFFKVRVRGLFPKQGSLEFISAGDVRNAQITDLPAVPESAPLVLGVDVARHGDDESVIYPRRGRDARSFTIHRLRGRKQPQLERDIIEVFEQFAALGLRPERIFIDSANFGIGVVDHLQEWGYPVTGVNFGSTANDDQTYRYRGDEMWGQVRNALLDGLALPSNDDETGADLETQLTQRLFGYTTSGAIHLETKKDMKTRLGGNTAGSPDIADALALTYAVKLVSSGKGSKKPGPGPSQRVAGVRTPMSDRVHAGKPRYIVPKDTVRELRGHVLFNEKEID